MGTPQLHRTATWGMIPKVESTCSAEESLDMFRRICRARFFDIEAFNANKRGVVQALIYLSAGQESISAAVSTIMEGSYLFTQHRGHAPYLSFGGDMIALIDELLGLPTGCCKGMGGSPCIQDRSKKIIGHEGLIGEQVPIAVGAALGDPKATVVCFFGDGAAEEDYIFGALGFAATHRLRIMFVCEDNDLSVLTPIRDRRSWQIHEVARSMGITAVDITDDPWLVRHHTKVLSANLPAFLNCRTCRYYWHVGSGQDGDPEWDRFALVKSKLKDMGLEQQSEKIEAQVRQQVSNLWTERLRIQSAS